MAKLTFVVDEGQELVVPLVDAATLTLGRGDDNDVVVDDARVSIYHATLERNAEGDIELRDLNSTTGTFVNGERVQTRCIRHGDTLAFGPLTAIFDLEEPVPTNGHAVLNGGTSRLIPAARGAPASREGAETAGARRELAALAEEKTRLQQAVAAAQADVREHTAERDRLQTEISSAQAKLQSWQERVAREMREHTTRMDTLRVDEKRLAQVKGAVVEAEALHQQWVDAVREISAEHQKKSIDVERLTTAEAAARHEVEALTLHRDQALAHLQQVREDSERDDAHLGVLREQTATLEQHHKHVEGLAQTREDQVRLAEKKLADMADHRTRLETHIQELTGAEEKLVLAMERCHEAEAGLAGLIAAIATRTAEQQRLGQAIGEAEARVLSLEEEQNRLTSLNSEADASRQRGEEALRTLQSEIQNRQGELAAETQRLEDTTARRAEITRQCEELAGTEAKLAGLLHQFTLAEERHEELMQGVAGAESKLSALAASITTLQGKEDSAKGRLEVLHGRENDLRAELGKLATAEHDSRARFEELRELISQAEQEHQNRLDEHGAKARACHQELHELESKLAPFRDWKDAMDQLYARLSELPQDSAEARDLWHEIEREKEDLEALISNARTQAREVSVKRPASPMHPPSRSSVAEAVEAGVRHAAMPVNGHVNGDGSAHGDSAGHAHHAQGHGAASAAALVQERTLKARLNHLRENVQREESRLEFLRHERGRHEVRARTSGPADEAMQREHDRHLEAKIRHDEEHLHALHHQLELAKGEEEKRRAKIVEMEHKMTELHAGITDAERHRSELRHQADLAHTELKNFEAAHERLKKAAAEEATKQESARG